MLFVIFNSVFDSYAGTWEKRDENWYYLKDNGVYANNEIILDDLGEIYCFNALGCMLYNQYNKDGLYFSNSGAWVNPNCINKKLLDDKWNDLNTNRVAVFEDKSDIANALNYYSFSKLISIPRNVQVNCKDNRYSLTMDSISKDINLLNEYSLSLYNIAGSLKSENDLDTLVNIANYVISNSNYDTSKDGAYDLLTSGLGCCAAYTQLFNKLCGNLGYPAEAICVYVSTGYHCINRVLIDNVWHYYDVTFYDQSKDMMYLDIDKNMLLQYYTLGNKGIFGK